MTRTAALRHGTPATGRPPVATALPSALPADRVLVDDDVIGSYLHDGAEWGRFGTPASVVRPSDTAEVQPVVVTDDLRAACAAQGLLLEREGLASELAPEVVARQRAVKAALDPHGMLNRGEVFPDD